MFLSISPFENSQLNQNARGDLRPHWPFHLILAPLPQCVMNNATSVDAAIKYVWRSLATTKQNRTKQNNETYLELRKATSG